MPKSTPSDGKVNPLPAGPGRLDTGPEAVSLPCLYSNNGIENTATDGQEKAETVLNLCNLLSPYHKRQAHTLFSNVHRLVTKVATSVGHVGFLTLTFPDNLTDNTEVRERFRSFNTNFLSKHPSISEWISTKEVQKRGAWHFHLVVALTENIAEGVNWEEMEKGVYRSAPQPLRNLWKELREALPNYGFGRSELMPIKSGPDAIARYVGKYISKHIGNRTEEQKGVRLISYSKGWIRNGCQFAWNTKNAAEWRRKLALFAKWHGCQEYYQLSAKLGQGWAYRYAQDIMDIDKVLQEERWNAREEDREPRTTGKYEDPTITRANRRKEAREKKMMKELVNHARVGLNLEEKRKIEVAKQGVNEWKESLSDVGQYQFYGRNTEVEDGYLVVWTGKRKGEILF